MPRTVRTLAVEYRLLSAIRGATRNPKGHDLPAIRASFDRFGLGDVAGIVDERTGRLVAGHGRIGCLLDMEATSDPPPAGVQVEADGWHVPVLTGVRFQSATEAEAFLLAHNRTVELGGWRNDELQVVLADHRDSLTGTGYTLDDLPVVGGDQAEDHPELVQPPDKPVSRPGDLWQLGDHRLVVGDCTDPAVWELLSPPPADQLWTDPPYGISYEATHAGQTSATRKTSRIENDDLRGPELAAFLTASLSPALAACRPGASVFVAAPSGRQLAEFIAVALAQGWWRQTIIWIKDQFVLGHADYHGQSEFVLAGTTGTDPVPLYDDDSGEPILYGWNPGAPHQPPPDRRQSTLWDIPRPRSSDEHPTMKPVALVARSIRNHTRPDDLVLDPFLGSGSTLIAAAMTGRVCYGIEKAPGYADVIVRRWAAHTGRTPLRNGRPRRIR